MKRLLILLTMAAFVYLGYQYFVKKTSLSLPPIVANNVSRLPVSKPKTDFLQVLGTSTTNLIAKGTDLLNNATGGTAEPIINKAVSDLQDRVKDLPAEQYKKVKYEFCKDVLMSPQPSKDSP